MMIQRRYKKYKWHLHSCVLDAKHFVKSKDLLQSDQRNIFKIFFVFFSIFLIFFRQIVFKEGLVWHSAPSPLLSFCLSTTIFHMEIFAFLALEFPLKCSRFPLWICLTFVGFTYCLVWTFLLLLLSTIYSFLQRKLRSAIGKFSSFFSDSKFDFCFKSFKVIILWK